MLGILKNPKVNTLAHPGRILALSLELDLYFDDMLEIFEEVSQVAAKNNIMWEINEHDKNMVRSQYHDRWHEIYQIALDAGVKLVYGSDSHLPEEIGGYEFVNKILTKLPKDCLETPEKIGL